MLSFDQTLEKLEAVGLATSKARFGLAISKADLVGGESPLGDPGDRPWVRQWLGELGLGNLMRAAQHNFRRVGCFFTASRPDGTTDGSVGALTRWVLHGERWIR
jgi:hypothetical protein